MTSRALLALAGASAALAAFAEGARAQCTSTWDTASGNPGIAGGYAAPIYLWNGRVHVGGSFTSAGGSAANRYLGAWDPGTTAWSSLGSGINGGFTNAFMTSLVAFNPGGGERLVAGGFYDNAGNVPATASLAMWNGASWEAMGTTWTGSTRGSIWAMGVWNGRLYVGGGIVNTSSPGVSYPLGGQPWYGVSSWDGAAWQSHSGSIAGFSPYVGAFAVFNDGSGEALYAAGRFTSINGTAGTGLIARWDGTSWSSVGGGLTSTSTFTGLEGLVVFNDGSGPALYAAGGAFFGSGLPTTNVAKWNGASWTALGGQIGTGRLTCITSFDDGAGAKLYIGGTAMPQINYFARWENSQWTVVDGGITGPGLPPSNFPSVFGMGVASGKLYVGGNFSQVNNLPAAGLAARTPCAGACYANCDGSTTAPVLNVQDFSCFLGKFASGDPYANCDGSTQPPTLNVQDFSCFLGKFAAGCP